MINQTSSNFRKCFGNQQHPELSSGAPLSPLSSIMHLNPAAIKD
ncbi:MAG: hypothetical protein R8K20_00440 [Gallionellaceae bacterium]